ncbi:MAG TPA: TolC family protein [Pyrinomonadaceae bacterium]|nr:TolC family protein [Pyrinomonadaceae bacterium]
MLTNKPIELIRVISLAVVFTAGGGAALAQTQTQTPRPTPNPRQSDATRPPGSETQVPSTPPGTQPGPPTAAPATQQPAPQAPPGTSTAPTNQPAQPSTSPTTVPSPEATSPAQEATPLQDPREPVFPTVQQRPLPPMPDMHRLGITSTNTLTLSLNDAVRKALQNNNDIEVARDDVRFAETQLRSLEGFYDPIFSLTPQIDKRVTPVQNIFAGAGTSGQVSNTVYTLSPSIFKPFSTGGGNYELSFSNNKTVTSATNSTLNPFYSSNLALSFTQPLLRNRSIDNQRRQIRIQKKRLEQSDADFRLRTIDVISRVQQAYWELVFALRDQQNQLENLNLSRENLRNVEAQIAVGAKAPLERAEVQTELANRESALLVAVQNVSIAENNLKQLILKDPQNPEWSAQLTPTDMPTFDTTPVDLNQALKEARDNRPELRRLNLQNEINDIDLKFFKNQTRPQVDLVGTVATTGLAGTAAATLPPGTLVPLISGDPNQVANAFLLSQIQDIQRRAVFPVATTPLVETPSLAPSDLVGGYGKTLSNLFSLNTYNVTVGVAIQIPLRNRTAEANFAGARIQKDQLAASTRSQEQIIEVDVRNSAQAVETARLRVISAREARANAELQLEGEQRLYQVGRSTTFLLFQRQNALTNARNAELRAETDYNKALASLQRATSSTLRSNNVVVEDPVP